MNVRDSYWDFLKGILILLVFFIHSHGGWNYDISDFYLSTDTLSFKSWYLFRCFSDATVPVFFFISGYLLSTKIENLWNYYKKRSRRVTIPYIVWTLIYSAAALFIYHTDITFFSVLLGTNGIHLYFLLVMIQLMLLTPFLVSVKNHKLMLFVCFLINMANALLYLRYKLIHKCVVPNEMILFICFIFYYYLGFFIRNNTNISVLNTAKSRCILFTVLLVSYLVKLKYNYFLLDYTGNIPTANGYNDPLNLLYSSAVILFALSVKDCYSRSTRYQIIEWIGVMSLDFYAVHWLFLRPIKSFVDSTFSLDYFWIINLSEILVTFLLCAAFVVAKEKIKKILKNPGSH